MVDEEVHEPEHEETSHEEEAASTPLVEEPKRWQIKFKSGQGQQVTHPSAEAAREWAVGHYGEDYEIESITELV